MEARSRFRFRCVDVHHVFDEKRMEIRNRQGRRADVPGFVHDADAEGSVIDFQASRFVGHNDVLTFERIRDVERVELACCRRR